MYDVASAVAQIDNILDAHADAERWSQYDDLSDLGPELPALVVRAQALIDRLTLPGSTYSKFAAQQSGVPPHMRLRPLIGVLHGLKADLEAGYLTTIVELLHASTFDDFLDMATELLDKGYKDPAAVLAGSVLESHLRQLCTKFGVSTATAAGAPKKADVMNADLVKATAYNTIEQKQVTADLGLRNSAAHGKHFEYTTDQVRNLISSVRQFLIRHPA